MLVTDAKWLEIRGEFTAQERARINRAVTAVTNEVIFPPGAHVDEEKLDGELRTRLRSLVLGRVIIDDPVKPGDEKTTEKKEKSRRWSAWYNVD